MTMIAYPDIVRFSPNRNFRLEARSPDNDPTGNPQRPVRDTGAKRGWGGFQDQFQYTLYRHETNAVIWTRFQDEKEASPHDVFVSDDGWCVLRTHHTFHAGLTIVSPCGKCTRKLDVGDLFKNRDDLLCWTSAGPFWAENSYAYFIAHNATTHFCVRTASSFHLLIDIQSGDVIDPARFAAELETAERRWVMDTLVEHEPFLRDWNDDESNQHAIRRIHVAAHIAGCLRVHESIPFLRLLERVESGGCQQFCHFLSSEKGWIVESNFPRLMARLSLQRLGEEPKGGPGYSVSRSLDASSAAREKYDIPCVENRDAKLKLVSAVMTPREILALVGMPDHFKAGTSVWEYDSSQAQNQTLRLTWDRSTWKMVSIEFLSPAQWSIPNERDQEIL